MIVPKFPMLTSQKAYETFQVVKLLPPRQVLRTDILQHVAPRLP